MQELVASGRSALSVDDEMVRRALIDRAAFAPLYARYRDPVFRYLLRRAGSEEVAADLTASTFERAVAGLAAYRAEGAGFAAWLFRIARNTANDHGRRQRRWRPLDLLRHDQPSLHPDPEAWALLREGRHELAAHLAELTDVQRECLVLRYAGDLTAAEIAAVIGKSEAAAQKHITRGLARLKEVYRDEFLR